MDIRKTRMVLYLLLGVIGIMLLLVRVFKVYETVFSVLGVGMIVIYFVVKQWKYKCPGCGRSLSANPFRKTCPHCLEIIR